MRAFAIAVAGLLLLGAAAGCLGGAEDGTEPVEGSSVDGEDTPASRATADDRSGNGTDPLTYAGEPVNATLWQNGTFAATDGCIGAGCMTGDAFHRVELSSQLPDAAPVTVHAELTYEASSAVFGDPLSLSVFSDDATFYGYESEAGEGKDIVEATLLKGEDAVVVQVFNAGPVEGETEIEYSLRVDVRSSPAMPSGAPVAVPAEPGDVFVAQPVPEDAGGPMRVLAYGPSDSFLGAFEAEDGSLEIPVPASSSAGDHVFVVPQASPAVELAGNASGAQMQPLTYAVSAGERHAVQGPQPVEWSFEVDKRPLAVGVAHRFEDPAAATTTQGQATVTGPEGAVLETAVGCGFCLGSGFQSHFVTSVGEAGAVAGSYDAVYEPTAEAGTSVTELVVTYQR